MSGSVGFIAGTIKEHVVSGVVAEPGGTELLAKNRSNKDRTMKRAAISNRGFTLVELIVVMAMFVIVIAVAGDTFSRIMNRSSVQSKGAESNIEGMVGLEMMRKDLASVGFGLPWSFDSATITYNEVKPGGETKPREELAADYNVTPEVEEQTEVPMAVSGGNNIDLNPAAPSILINGTDYLVIRATSIGTSKPLSDGAS